MSSIISSSNRNDSILSQEDCSPISQACTKALTDRIEDKRKLAAREIEKMSCEFSLSNNLTMINRLIIVLARKFCLSNNPNARKGGLLGLAAVMVGYNNGAVSAETPEEVVEEVVRPILTCFQDSDPRVRYYACESLYNVTKVAGPSIIPLFREIFDNMTKIVADVDIGVRSGAELLDKLLKDIVVEHKTLEPEVFMPKLEDYIYTKNPFTRMFIISWIRLLDTKVDMIDYIPQLLDGIFNCLYDSTDAIRASTLNLLSEFLNKVCTRLEFDTMTKKITSVDLEPTLRVLVKKLEKEDHPVVTSAVLDWLRRLKKADSELVLSKKLFHYLLDILSARSDDVVKNGLSVLTELFCFDPNHSIDDANVLQFIQALCKMLHDKNNVFEERGTFIIINLCNIVRPDIIYKSFAEILREEGTDYKFAYNMVQKLNQILLTTQPLFALRSRLANTNTNTSGDGDDSESTSLFLSLYYAWCYSPIAVLTLCLLTNNYKHANEIVIAISQADINVDVLTQIDWVVQLIESPVFAALRMKMLDANNNQYLLKSLYGLLMILPQSEAFTKLGNRLDHAYKFMSVQSPTSRSSLAKTTNKDAIKDNKDAKKAPSQSERTKVDTLMKHYFSIQNQQ